MMREVVYTDEGGKKFKVLIPDEAPDTHAKFGLIVGPPDLSALNIPKDMEIRLNNQLFNRGLFTNKDVLTRRREVVAALQATLALDADKIINLYRGI